MKESADLILAQDPRYVFSKLELDDGAGCTQHANQNRKRPLLTLLVQRAHQLPVVARTNLSDL